MFYVFVGSETNSIGFVIEFYPFCRIRSVRSSISDFILKYLFLVFWYFRSQELRWVRSLRRFFPSKNIQNNVYVEKHLKTLETVKKHYTLSR